MCSRFVLSSPWEALKRTVQILSTAAAAPVGLRPRFNIAPSTQITVARRKTTSGDLVVEPMKWGLLPSWTKDPRRANRLLNARSETAARKPSFRSSFSKRRCLIPADGFYEWTGPKGKKQPHYIHLKSRMPFVMAGLYSFWRTPEGDRLGTVTILTTESNALIECVHKRMPCILPAEHHEGWLDSSATRDDLQTMLGPFDPDAMAMYEVRPTVNKVGFDEPSCIEPLPQLSIF